MALRPRYVAAGAAGLAYLGLSQWLMTRTPPSAWTAVALLTPMLALAAIGFWRSGHRIASGIAVGLFCTLVFQASQGSGFAPDRLYLIEHVAIHAFLAITFGVTLRPGARPLISVLADRVHRGLTPDMERYTRKLTLAWTIYFVAMALVSLAIHALASFSTWAVFANAVTPVAMVSMFVGEYVLRYRLHPEFERASFNDMIRAYSQMNDPAPAPPASGPVR
ncbi:MAG: hypothetical protein ABIV63_00785 [Caldimonas sp.]